MNISALVILRRVFD